MTLSKNFTTQTQSQSKNKNNQVLLLSEEGEQIMKGITKRKDGFYMIRKTIGGIRKTYYAKTLIEARSIYSKLCKNTIKDNKGLKGKTGLKKEFVHTLMLFFKKQLT